MVLTRNQRKRQRAAEASLRGLGGLGNVPEVLLPTVASFLPKTSAAILASLFADPTDGRPTSASAAVLSAFDDKDWEVMEFTDARPGIPDLDDVDLRAILLAIDAKCKTKEIYLLGSMSGRGLAPLRGSTVLEKLVSYDWTNRLDFEPLEISCVISIIESILAKRNASFQCCYFSQNRLDAHDEAMVIDFTKKYEYKLGRCGAECSWIFRLGSECQGQSCQECGQEFCRECAEGSWHSGVQFPCDQCQRYLCNSCSGGGICDIGGMMACSDCADRIERWNQDSDEEES